jgi:outer membrane protein OmpA-like peptidoglycan-associated protein
MLFSRGEINVWPGFSDLMFVFAVTLLVISGGVVALTVKKSQALAKQQSALEAKRQQLRLNGLDPDASEPCGLGAPVINTLQSCLASANVAVERRGCALAVKSTILFETNKDSLSPAARVVVERIAPCIIDAAKKVATSPPIDGMGLDSIIIEGHADRCGYADWRAANDSGMGLSARRAQAVYDVVFERVIATGAPSGALAPEQILGRIANRAFGPYRPVAGSKCDCSEPHERDCEADRRVEIAVQGKVGTASDTWKAPSAIYFTGKHLRHRPSAIGQSAEKQENR